MLRCPIQHNMRWLLNINLDSVLISDSGTVGNVPSVPCFPSFRPRFSRFSIVSEQGTAGRRKWCQKTNDLRVWFVGMSAAFISVSDSVFSIMLLRNALPLKQEKCTMQKPAV